MSASYHHLAVADVQPGMVLSDELLDPQGQVLLPQGTVLTEAMIALMPRHGITALPILQAAPDPRQLAIAQQALRQRIDHLFRHHPQDDDSDWAAHALRQLITDYRIGKEASA
jgi:hypothetical protein